MKHSTIVQALALLQIGIFFYMAHKCRQREKKAQQELKRIREMMYEGIKATDK
ncbi:MAG: hypothetical protein PHD51_01440 [Patescibacteria group bacterium]|nr:hypothetical protein [Patescibacteria group bacterium]MDD5490475.1 hypothetical protein [Patescibacteria group bacterium]